MPMIGGIINHLWQSTLFALVAGLLAFALRNGRAHVRYWLWLSASFKFIVPFSLLISFGGVLQRIPAAKNVSPPAATLTIVKITEPFSPASAAEPAPASPRDWVPIALVTIWLVGMAGVALIRIRGWLRIASAVRASTPMQIPAPVEIRSSRGLLEPGVVGWFRPILLLPADILERLTPPQLDSVVAHELCHIRRRDNLTAAIHMLVEALFWFHPFVWWIGGRLVDERERACDEEVLRLGAEPQIYAGGILKVCTSYLESPLSSVSGVTGSDLKKRIQAILAERFPGGLNIAQRSALTFAGIVALILPVGVGMLHPSATRAQSAQASARKSPAPSQNPQALDALGYVAAQTVTVKPRIDGQLLSVSFKEGDQVKAGQILASIDPRPFQLQLAQAQAQLVRDQAQLVTTSEPEVVRQVEAAIKSDQVNLQKATLQMNDTQIDAPISGTAGLRLVDPGNMVYAAADAPGIVVITGMRPVAVVFSLAEDNVPAVLARLREGASLSVEAWNRARSAKIATGHLTGVDNQMDQFTGTVKLKAMFDNRDGALFPNQFVNVRLLLSEQ